MSDDKPEWLKDKPDNYLEDYIPEEWPEKYATGDPDEVIVTDKRIDHESIMYFYPLSMLGELRENVQQALEEREIEMTFSGGGFGYYLSFFATAASFLEHRTNYILHDELFTEQHKGANSSWNFLEHSLNQKQREELLFRTGLIDSGLKGKMAEVRRHRNKLVHNPHESLYIESVEEMMNNIDDAIETFKDMNELMRERIPRKTFQGVPPEDIPADDLS